MFFDDVQHATPDVMYFLKVQADGDTHPDKVDLGVGVYRNEQGAYHELKALREAKTEIFNDNPDHDYEVTTGNADYVRNAARVVFGTGSEVLESGKVASIQTISGTGAVHIAVMFLAHSVPSISKVAHVGMPAWGNYHPMLKLAGFNVQSYQHYDPDAGAVDWDATLKAVQAAPERSVFVLQACCHNPTAVDFSIEQWQELARKFKERRLFPLFDIAYQGIGKGLEEDAYGVRHFAETGLEMLICQSFSKNLGLYGERVGALHAVCSALIVAPAIHDQLRFLIRSEFSSSPAYGSRLVTNILSNPARERLWREELDVILKRIQGLRADLFHLLSGVFRTPGDWSVLIKGTGLFSLLPLTISQCKTLCEKHHIYLVQNGRINVSGLNERNMDYVAKSIDTVVRESKSID